MIKPQILLVLAAGMLLAACGQEPRPPLNPATPQTLSALPAAALAGLDVPSDYARGGHARLVKGVYQEEPDPLTGTRLTVRLTSWVASGDLSGDGSPDSALVLETDAGGSGVFYDLAVVSNQDGRPGTVQVIPLGDRISLKGLKIVDGVVQAELAQAGPADPACCPSQRVSRQFRLQGDRLVSMAPAVPTAG